MVIVVSKYYDMMRKKLFKICSLVLKLFFFVARKNFQTNFNFLSSLSENIVVSEKWAFDYLGNMFSCAGACKLDRVSHIIILEILEVGIEQHSAARSIPDAERERQIRGAFPYVPVDVLYIVVAAYNHPTAHRNDQFFRKPSGSLEYELVPNRTKAWTERVAGALSQLRRMYDSKLGETVFIGH